MKLHSIMKLQQYKKHNLSKLSTEYSWENSKVPSQISDLEKSRMLINKKENMTGLLIHINRNKHKYMNNKKEVIKQNSQPNKNLSYNNCLKTGCTKKCLTTIV